MIYFLEAVGVPVIKVGYSAFPANRLQNCSTWSPVPLKLAAVDERGDMLTEAELLRRLRPYRSHGEWFHAVAAVREIVRETKRTGSIPAAWYLPANYVCGTTTERGPALSELTERYGITAAQLRRIAGTKATIFGAIGIPIRYVIPLLEHLQQRDPAITLEALLGVEPHPLRAAA